MVKAGLVLPRPTTYTDVVDVLSGLVYSFLLARVAGVSGLRGGSSVGAAYGACICPSPIWYIGIVDSQESSAEAVVDNVVYSIPFTLLKMGGGRRRFGRCLGAKGIAETDRTCAYNISGMRWKKDGQKRCRSIP